MPPKLALLIGVVFVYYAIRSERNRTAAIANGVFWPMLWYMATASRPLGVWLLTWGIPLPTGSGDSTDGSIIDQIFYTVPIVFGLRILLRRRFDLQGFIRFNPWLSAFIALMAISILWSQYPFVSFKRYIKIIGSIIMALVVLTNDHPWESFLTLLRRCLYVHLPMSIISIRYFREIGVSFDWSGAAESWQGISTSKNVLGQVAVLGVLYFFWEVRRHWQEYRWRSLHVLYLLMALYLLKGSDEAISMTSVSVCVFAAFVLLRIQSHRSRPTASRFFVLAAFGATVTLVVFVLIHSVVVFPSASLFGHLITFLGRDITMTGRTDIWSDVYAATSGSPLLGIGFGGFWIGRIANIPWNENMTWVLGQGHNGYVDTYLQLGIIGSMLLAIVFFSRALRLLTLLSDNFDFTCFRITLLLTIMFINITESIYLRGDHHLWFILMVVLWGVPSMRLPLANEDSELTPIAAAPKPKAKSTGIYSET